jgi:hypothetical protein
MAGHRRDNEVLPERQRVIKMKRRRAAYVKRMAAAHTPDEQFMAAVYYIRSVLGVVPARLSKPVLDTLIDTIEKSADSLAAGWSREGGYDR